MTKRVPVAKTPLWQRIAASLEPAGFEARAAKRRFVRRRGGLYDVVELGPDRDDPNQYKVLFACWSPQDDELAVDPSADQSAAIDGFAHLHQTSLVAPLKNSWWWNIDPQAAPDGPEGESLTLQLERLALPYFDSIPDEAAWQAVKADQERLWQPSEAVVATLAAGAAGRAGFVRSDALLWRRREGVIDLLAVEALADGRFASVNAAVWHESLVSGIQGELPQGVTLATSRQVCADGVDGDPLQGLWFVHGEDVGSAALQALEASVSPVALAWFDTVRSREEVIKAIPEAFRRYLLGD